MRELYDVLGHCTHKQTQISICTCFSLIKRHNIYIYIFCKKLVETHNRELLTLGAGLL